MALANAWIIHCPHPWPPEETMFFALDEERGPKILLCPACWEDMRAILTAQAKLPAKGR